MEETDQELKNLLHDLNLPGALRVPVRTRTTPLPGVPFVGVSAAYLPNPLRGARTWDQGSGSYLKESWSLVRNW